MPKFAIKKYPVKQYIIICANIFTFLWIQPDAVSTVYVTNASRDSVETIDMERNIALI